jgi:hypothetical protein
MSKIETNNRMEWDYAAGVIQSRQNELQGSKVQQVQGGHRQRTKVFP